MLLYLILRSCSSKIFSVFRCDHFYYGEGVDEQRRYLAADLSIDCGYPTNTPFYSIMTAYAFLMIIV